MAMRPCERCLENNWNITGKREEFNGMWHKWAVATCNICGNEVEFGHRETKIGKGAKAEYIINDGKRFLKIDGEYREVGLFNVKKGIQVLPLSHKKSIDRIDK